MSEWQKVEPSPTHDFEKEKELIGIFIGKETEVGPNLSNLYTFEKKGGEKVSVWGNTLLDSRFKNLKEGEEVRVVYLGKAKSPTSGREYHNFEVYHRDPEVSEEEIDSLVKGVE